MKVRKQLQANQLKADLVIELTFDPYLIRISTLKISSLIINFGTFNIPAILK